MNSYAVWPEGEPDKALFASSWLHARWLIFWIGIKSWWPDLRNAKRVLFGAPWTSAMSAQQVAELWEDMIRDGTAAVWNKKGRN